MNRPEHETSGAETEAQDPLRRFRSWHGFLAASIAVNVLFVYAMLGAPSDPSIRVWYKVLMWFPFNAIATGVYLAIMARLSRGAGSAAAAGFYVALCGLLIAANWALMLSA
ncbi:MAG: hypothetical protein MUC79_12495 [Thiobacillaceae bacterium]|nr:hypothetical protein [Thiobacillaceae bacterium]